MSIDYGTLNGKTLCNNDEERLVRYGVVSINSLHYDIWGDLESDFGDPSCPKCGTNDLVESEDGEYFCDNCDYTLRDGEEYPDEANGFYYIGDDCKMSSAFDNTCLFVTKSTHVMKVRLCSPCAPGAGDIDSPDKDRGWWAYCPPPSWWPEGKVPVMHEVSERKQWNLPFQDRRLEQAIEWVTEQLNNGGEWPDVSLRATEKFDVDYEALRDLYDGARGVV